ncbi:hypothetical protein EKH79_03575 [Dyella dinghuensis]|uniref:DUF2384 domain-containing protein n=1 Tax=Dyella dinghuensis TaxID=1920169 RepID=A0A432LV00_9GAMM|nr:hypothetical protein [Dyella dinghuensis]RUL65804.1 hypothetical protein EKH79_03575 [Dyella dinghuensis]
MEDQRPYELVPLQRLLRTLDEETRLDLEAMPRFIRWFDHERLSSFGGLTARQLVQDGRENDVARYLATVLKGFIG